MIRKFAITVLSLCLSAWVAIAQAEGDKPLYKDILYLGNLYSGSSNPVSASFAPLSDITDISLYGSFGRGDYHALDRAGRTNALEGGINGMHRLGKFDCHGGISFCNSKEFDRRWNNTMYISPDNPFILADSVSGDFNTEHFALNGTGSYRFSETFTAGIGLQYLTGSSAEQTDPRPKIDGMRFTVNPGVNFKFSERFAVGAYGKIELMNESVSHVILNTLRSPVYFRFKGMGDYSTFSSSKLPGYPRNYKGTSYEGGAQFAANPKGKTANLLTLYYGHQSEQARDGGSAFTFMGGDYAAAVLGLANRFSIRTDRFAHNIVIEASYKRVTGTWYEQTEELDPERNNQIMYIVRSQDDVHDEKITDAAASYRLDILHGTAPTLTIYAQARYTAVETDQFADQAAWERCKKAMVSLSAARHFRTGKSLLSVTALGEYCVPLSSSVEPLQRLQEEYTYPMFEYAAGSYASAGLKVSFDRPVDFSGFKTWIGIFATGNAAFYLGDNTYSSILDKSSYNRFTIGARVLF